MGTIKLILFSKQLLIRKAMACFINQQPGWETVAEEDDINKVSILLQRYKKPILIIDAEFPENEIGLAIKNATVVGAFPVIFSCQNNVKKLIKLMIYNANGYLTADLSPAEFKKHINDVYKGKHALSDSLIKEMINEIVPQEACYGR